MRSLAFLASTYLFSCASTAAVAPEPVSVQLEGPAASAPSIPASPEEPAVVRAPGQAELSELMERLIEVAQAGDMVGLAALFHPALQADVQRELTRATDEKMAEVITCIEEVLENGELYEGGVRSSIRQLGGRTAQRSVRGAPTSTIAVEADGQWYLVDTGC
ncbi:MAG: hypothetical protein AB8H86_06650 [Polyangiales bacterium]